MNDRLPGRSTLGAYRTRKEGEPMAILVRHAMTESPQTVKPEMTAGDAAALMKQLDVGVMPVAEKGKLLGLVTDRDLMAEHRVRRLPVMKGDELVGILALGDIALADASGRAVGDALGKISES